LNTMQAIALLDIRLFNTDRHGGNLLVSKRKGTNGKKPLIPIDHGLCLPDFHHLGELNIEWLYWRQAELPLGDEARKHVSSLDVDRDTKILRSLGLREQSILTMQLMTRFLKFAVLSLNWSLRAIGKFLSRSLLPVRGGDGPSLSDFEHLLNRAVATASDRSLPGFLRGDGSVSFTKSRAKSFLEAAEQQWLKELSPKPTTGA